VRHCSNDLTPQKLRAIFQESSSILAEGPAVAALRAIISVLITRATVPILRKFLAALALLTASLVLVAPATAARAHQVGHIPSPVDAGQYHHHATDGSADVHDDGATGQTDDQPDGNTSGHSHPPVLAVDPAMLEPVALTHPMIGMHLAGEWTVRELVTLSWGPQRRPPRDV
jgi:hypothetical protein